MEICGFSFIKQTFWTFEVHLFDDILDLLIAPHREDGRKNASKNDAFRKRRENDKPRKYKATTMVLSRFRFGDEFGSVFEVHVFDSFFPFEIVRTWGG